MGIFCNIWDSLFGVRSFCLSQGVPAEERGVHALPAGNPCLATDGDVGGIHNCHYRDEWVASMADALRRIRSGDGVYAGDVDTQSHLPTEAAKRKALPVATGFVDYFPDAMIAVAELSKIGNDQHNPGEPLHWAREKSTDESDALMRHFIERGTTDSDGVRHSAKVAWRAMALLQKEIENDRKA